MTALTCLVDAGRFQVTPSKTAPPFPVQHAKARTTTRTASPPFQRTLTTTASASSSSTITPTTQPPPPPPQSKRISRYPALRGDEFRHPFDQQNTALLRALPGMEFLARSVMSPMDEQVFLLENLGSSILVGPAQLPSLFQLFTEAAAILDMTPMPQLYVKQSPVPNAYTLAISGKQPFIVVHTALLDLLTPAETQAVLAHELGHLKCEHGVWLTAANILGFGTVSLLPWVTRPVQEALTRWLRAAELTCDRAALLVVQDPRIVCSVLMKLAGGSSKLASELSVEAFLQQARSYDEATSSSLGWYLRNAQTRALSHPLPVLRAKEVDQWSGSSEYEVLLTRGEKKKE